MVFETILLFLFLELRDGRQGDVSEVLKLGSHRLRGLETAQNGTPSSIQLVLDLRKLRSGWGEPFNTKLLDRVKLLVESGNRLKVIVWTILKTKQ